VEQSLSSNTNFRIHAYVESPENRGWFALELVNTVGQAIWVEKVGILLAPFEW
jgi:2,4-dienoyl-CoA reductase-like NADH-dependent reductase (Old Yellow Enzyme family)